MFADTQAWFARTLHTSERGGETKRGGKGDVCSWIHLTSVRLESLERHGLLVVVILVLPHIVTATCAALAPVVEVGHFHARSCAPFGKQIRTHEINPTKRRAQRRLISKSFFKCVFIYKPTNLRCCETSPCVVEKQNLQPGKFGKPASNNSSGVVSVFRNLTACRKGGEEERGDPSSSALRVNSIHLSKRESPSCERRSSLFGELLSAHHRQPASSGPHCWLARSLTHSLVRSHHKTQHKAPVYQSVVLLSSKT